MHQRWPSYSCDSSRTCGGVFADDRKMGGGAGVTKEHVKAVVLLFVIIAGNAVIFGEIIKWVFQIGK